MNNKKRFYCPVCKKERMIKFLTVLFTTGNTSSEICKDCKIIIIANKEDRLSFFKKYKPKKT